MKKKTIMYILVGILLYVTVLAIELCCIYAVQKENFWNYLKEYWDWFKTHSFL